ncbi:hypothetical protein G9272_32060 [Streptomyces asoensis]|uniref:HK97 gp10 family phage protein n=1 Tax=Streptomyces asoensis TaxID=249586 RepID=A0A6M4X886_9ACTN|nr:hypothetical protein [Streptomyces asoensis]QJT04353.1 hypothetical protein G9272_32060 [Streptomyces asoensis]
MARSFRLTWHGPAVERQLRQGAARGLLLSAEHVLGKSQEVVPLDESPLMHSGVASVEESTLTGMVSYDTPYAVIQHENLAYRHAPGRTAKYLENSLNGARAEVLAIIAAQLRRATR